MPLAAGTWRVPAASTALGTIPLEKDTPQPLTWRGRPFATGLCPCHLQNAGALDRDGAEAVSHVGHTQACLPA